ncbi:MAG: efflux RND transporter periplasmic adaptor subunit [Mucinivorans sp.]
MKKLFYYTFAAIMISGCGGETKPQQATDNRIERAQTVNLVDTIHLSKGLFRSQLISNGKLRAKQKSELKFSASGIVEQLNVSNGSHIGKGMVIAALEVGEQQLRLRQALTRLEKAKIDLADALLGFGYTVADSAKVKKEHLQVARLRSGYDSAEDDVAAAKLSIDKSTLKAPFGGKIANLKTKLWENPKGDFFCTVIDDGSFDIEFAVLESELKSVHQGQQVKVATFIEPQKSYSGTISSINQMVDDKGQVLVTATIPNPGGLMDGMNVKVFVENVILDKLVVPKSAVVIRDNLEVLFRMTPEGKTIWTYVYIEAANSDSYVVVANTDRGADLSPGDVIIVRGNLNLADNVDVQIK